ncbi:hypothetical protein [Caballeronia terrestris]|nr:hypothetical protein [Caballeronia terrestris]
MTDLDPFEEEVIQVAKTLAENSELKIALFKLREVMQQRLEGRD